MHPTLGLLCIAVAITGCSSMNAPSKGLDTQAARPHSIERQTNRDLSLALAHKSRGGAAYRQAGYVHALVPVDHTGKPAEIGDTALTAQSINDTLPDTTDPTTEAAREFIALHQNHAETSGSDSNRQTPAGSTKAGRGYSVYELSRWERYCNEGKGMDKADWDFVTAEGTENTPLDVLPNCNPPAPFE